MSICEIDLLATSNYKESQLIISNAVKDACATKSMFLIFFFFGLCELLTFFLSVYFFFLEIDFDLRLICNDAEIHSWNYNVSTFIYLLYIFLGHWHLRFIIRDRWVFTHLEYYLIIFWFS